MDEDEGSEVIARSLEQGWDFDPSWRHNLVGKYLVAGASVDDPLQVLGDEKDAYCRQYYLMRRTGACMSRDSFLWAYRCHTNNRKTGAASLIKAMIVAKFSTKEIAAKLRTSTRSIAVFTKLFFDVERYIEDREWLASIAFPPGDASEDLATFRERRWMAAAYTNGRAGLERSLSRKVAIDPAEREQLTSEIRAALTCRAHEFVAGMQSNFVPPSGEDFDRLLKMMDTAARQALPDNRETTMQLFIQGIHGVLQDKAAEPEFANDERLQALRREPVTPEDDGKAPCT